MNAALTDTERADRATAILGIIRQLDDDATIDEIAVVARVMQRFERMRASRGDHSWSALDDALQLELTDVRLEREHGDRQHEAARDVMVSTATA